jgi:uncharacterized membrane protein
MKFYNRIDLVDEPAFITFWSYIHLLSGLALFISVSFVSKLLTEKELIPWVTILIAFCIHLLYESKDMYFSYISERKPKNSNSILNSLGDQLCATIGMLIGYIVLGTSCTSKEVLAVLIAYLNVFLLATTINYERVDNKE